MLVLGGVGTGFIKRFDPFHVTADLQFAKRAKLHAADLHERPRLARRLPHGPDAGINFVRAPAEPAQHGEGFVQIPRFAKTFAIKRNERVHADHDRIRKRRCHRQRLLLCVEKRDLRYREMLRRDFLNRSRMHGKTVTVFLQQLPAAGRSGRKNEMHRKKINGGAVRGKSPSKESAFARSLRSTAYRFPLSKAHNPMHSTAPMKVDVINTGTELLLGSVVNAHLAFFAHALFPLGLRIQRQVTVPDGEEIRNALSEALARADVVLVTGGLGPTTDDVTRDITAELLGRPLRDDAGVMEVIRGFFERRGLAVTERVGRQAQVPEGALVLPNVHGTAPGLYILDTAGQVPGGRPVHLFLLPGPPRELQPMFTDSVLPILKQIRPSGLVQGCRVYHVLGMGESNVEALLGKQLLAIPGLELGYCARPGEVDIRCIGLAPALDAAEQIIAEVVGDRIASRDGRSSEEVVVAALTHEGQTVATAESCTGGALASRITNVSGASAVMLAGYVTYSNEAKTVDLGVDPVVINTHGAVSAEVAAAMAEGALNRTGADWALSTTGIAGPTGGTGEKPVGTVFIGLARRGKKTAQVEKHRFARDRKVFKHLATQTALDLLRRAIAGVRLGKGLGEPKK